MPEQRHSEIDIKRLLTDAGGTAVQISLTLKGFLKRLEEHLDDDDVLLIKAVIDSADAIVKLGEDGLRKVKENEQ